MCSQPAALIVSSPMQAFNPVQAASWAAACRCSASSQTLCAWSLAPWPSSSPPSPVWASCRCILGWCSWLLHELSPGCVCGPCRPAPAAPVLVVQRACYASQGGAAAKRSDAVAKFDSEPGVRVFLLSLSAGAQGLTLNQGERQGLASCLLLCSAVHGPRDLAEWPSLHLRLGF